MEKYMRAQTPHNPENALKLIYLVEDDLLTSKVIKEILVKNGYNVERFNCIKPLIKAINQTKPDLLIMDINLPEGKYAGVQFLYYLKKEIPAIIITANENASTRYEAAMNGAKFYLKKPLNPQDIILRVDQALNDMKYC